MKHKLTLLFAVAAFVTSTAFAGSDSASLNEDNWAFDFGETDTMAEVSPDTTLIGVGDADNWMFERELMREEADKRYLIDSIDDEYHIFQ